MAAISIPAGRWADRADPRATLLLSMIGIGVASVLGALAPSFELLLASRVLQGAAAGLLVVVYMPIVTAAVREAQPGRAIGFIITIMTVGGMAGMPLGGLVAGALSWRQVFLIKLPLLAVVFWLGYRSVRVPAGDCRGRAGCWSPRPCCSAQR
jgi:DHA2 family multidrug resistance protein-like MFS transporter